MNRIVKNLSGELLTGGGGSGVERGGKFRGKVAQEHYGLCWRPWNDQGIPEFTTELPTASVSLVQPVCLPLLSVSLFPPHTKLRLSSAEHTVQKRSLCQKASTSHGNAFRIDPAKRGHKDALCRVRNRQSQYFLSFEDCCGGAFTKRRASKRELNVRKTQSLVYSSRTSEGFLTF